MKMSQDEFKEMCDRARAESLDTGGRASVVEFCHEKMVMGRVDRSNTFLGVDSPRIRDEVKRRCVEMRPPENPPYVVTVFVVYEDGACVDADDDKIGELF